jgi:hypothetical protein
MGFRDSDVPEWADHQLALPARWGTVPAMESFDRSLKHLLALAPAELLGFGLGHSVHVIRPVEPSLSGRGREIDGCYLIEDAEQPVVIHVEFHRRHQALQDLALDVAEAQLRLFCREKLPVWSLVWDLYGRYDEPVLSERESIVGPDGPRLRCTYQRVNLRGMGWRELLTQGPPSLWSLVALTRDGQSQEALRGSYDAIVNRTIPESQRADQLAVLWFVAEAEQVPVQWLQTLLSRERLMQSTLYQQIFTEGEARGKASGRLEHEADAIQRVLAARLGFVDLAVRQRVKAETDDLCLSEWYQEALLCTDAEGARKLADKIRQAPAVG